MTDRTRLVLILALALVVRLSAGVWWQSRLNGKLFAFGDSETYWTLAAHLANGEPYEYGTARVFRTPGYPVLLAPAILLFGEGQTGVHAARVLNAALAVGSIAGVYWLGQFLFTKRVGCWAAFALAFLPDAIGLGVFVLSEAPFCPLMVAQLALACAAWKAEIAARSRGLAFASGAVAGLATLMRPSWLLFVPFTIGVGLAGAWIAGLDRRRHAMLGAATLAGLVLAMAPWWIRNGMVTGHFVPTSLQAGASLYDGLNPLADGSSNMAFGNMAELFELQFPFPEQLENSPQEFEYQNDLFLRDLALQWARENPGRALELAGIKFLRLWNIWPNEPAFRSLPLRLAVACTYVPLMLLAGFGAWRHRSLGWPIVLLILPAVYITGLHVIFVASIRYRQPALLPLAILAAAGLAAFFSKRSHASSSLVPSP